MDIWLSERAIKKQIYRRVAGELKILRRAAA